MNEAIYKRVQEESERDLARAVRMGQFFNSLFEGKPMLEVAPSQSAVQDAQEESK